MTDYFIIIPVEAKGASTCVLATSFQEPRIQVDAVQEETEFTWVAATALPRS